MLYTVKKFLDSSRSFLGLNPGPRTFANAGVSDKLETAAQYFYRQGRDSYRVARESFGLKDWSSLKRTTFYFLQSLLNFSKSFVCTVSSYLPPYTREIYTVKAAEAYTDPETEETIPSLKEYIEKTFSNNNGVIEEYDSDKLLGREDNFIERLFSNQGPYLFSRKNKQMVVVGCIEENFLFGSVKTQIVCPLSMVAQDIALKSRDNDLAHPDAFKKQVKAGFDSIVAKRQPRR